MGHAELKEWTLLSPLPDLFEKDGGGRIASAEEWAAQRERIYRYGVGMQYGGMPPEPEFVEVELLHPGSSLNTYRIHTGKREKPITFIMQTIIPKEAKNCPVVIDGDGCFPYVYRDDILKEFEDAGVAFVRFNRTEIVHDDYSPDRGHGLYEVYPEYTFSALAAWAWGFHRCTDAVLQLGFADPDWIVYTGHSRGGKTALLAGATDPRAAIVNPNGSGTAGAACYRLRSRTLAEDGSEEESEPLSYLLGAVPYWLGPEMKEYGDREAELPFDSHFLKALVAPRILLCTDALSDGWANPIGTYMTSKAAKEVFRFLGAEDHIMNRYREGVHSHTPDDVSILLNVLAHFRSGAPLDETIDHTPFDAIPPVHTWRCPGK